MGDELKPKFEFKDVLNAVFKLTDYLNFLWNFYVIFNVAVIGWLFSSSGSDWVWQKKLTVSIIYVFFVYGNITIIRRTYGLLSTAFEELKLAASELEFRSENFSAFFSQNAPFDKDRSLTFHIIADIVVLLSIWLRGIYL